MSNNPNIFERLSDGRFIDLGSRLTSQQIELLGLRPFRPCPECNGEGFVGMAMAVTDIGLMIAPLPCPLCQGEGEAQYQSHN